MSYQDKQLKCKDCGENFAFTAGEQDFFATKGFSPPPRCPDCRKKKKSRHDKKEPAPQARNDGRTYNIVCSSCSKSVEVPFQPRNPEGVLCAQCFEKKNKNEKNKL